MFEHLSAVNVVRCVNELLKLRLFENSTMWTTRNIPDQTGKIVIITGANTGIGYETALALYEAGAYVVLACRDMNKAEAAKKKIEAQNGKGFLETASLDLGELSAVEKFADDFGQRHKQLNALINNAGVANTGVNAPFEPKTVDGYEQQFGINFLGHFCTYRTTLPHT